MIYNHFMDQNEILKMLRSIANAQSAMRAEMLSEFKALKESNTKEHVEINRRIDLLGSDLANLDEDAPTSEEFNKLEKRVTKLEKKIALN